MIPEAMSSWLYLPMASINSWLGNAPVSDVWVAFTKIMNRMVVAPICGSPSGWNFPTDRLVHRSMMQCAREEPRHRAPPRGLPLLSAWNGQYGHDLDGVARENRKVRMVVEELGGGFVRIRTHNRECAHFIAYIVDSTLRDLLGFPQWSAHADNGGLMFLDPRLPGRHPFSFLRTSIALGKGVPGHSSRTSFAAKEHCEIGIVRAHNVSFDLRFSGWNN